LSTKEEALKKAREQKAGIDRPLQQAVEEAVRKALDGTLPLDGEKPSSRSFTVRKNTVLENTFSGKTFSSGDSDKFFLRSKEIDSIAINIKRQIGEGKKGAVLFTSSVTGEGTTTVCSNVSLALTKICTGNILLLDGNARHPQIHALFDLDPLPGLTDVLLGKILWEDAVRISDLKNFYILPFGQPLREPLPLLGSEGMEGLLSALKTEFDFILLDLPPILESVEAEMIALWVEASVLIIQARATRKEVVRRAVERFIRHRTFLGAVFNQETRFIPRFRYQRLK
jgi:capsular exopolysaccharide synthesis family protein